jgi:hypothetical protein
MDNEIFREYETVLDDNRTEARHDLPVSSPRADRHRVYGLVRFRYEDEQVNPNRRHPGRRQARCLVLSARL